MENRVVIGENPDLQKKRFSIRDENWIAIDTVREPIKCEVQIRNRFEPQPATVFKESDSVVVEFTSPQRAITPGQAAVFYWDDVVIGGGWIRA